MADSEKNQCFICFEGGAPLMQSGCACRGAAGRAHPNCRAEAAEALAKRKGWKWWFTCQTCEQRFTGGMCIELANAWWSRVRERAEDDSERLAAAHNMGISLSDQGKYAEAEEIHRHVLLLDKRVLGPRHPDTLTTACNLARSLWDQGKYAEAEEIEREVLVGRGVTPIESEMQFRER